MPYKEKVYLNYRDTLISLNSTGMLIEYGVEEGGVEDYSVELTTGDVIEMIRSYLVKHPEKIESYGENVDIETDFQYDEEYDELKRIRSYDDLKAVTKRIEQKGNTYATKRGYLYIREIRPEDDRIIFITDNFKQHISDIKDFWKKVLFLEQPDGYENIEFK